MPPFTLKLASKKFSMAMKNTQQMPKCHDFSGKTTMFFVGGFRGSLVSTNRASLVQNHRAMAGMDWELWWFVHFPSYVLFPIGSVCMVYMATFTINIPQMWAYIYIPYMDPIWVCQQLDWRKRPRFCGMVIYRCRWCRMKIQLKWMMFRFTSSNSCFTCLNIKTLCMIQKAQKAQKAPRNQEMKTRFMIPHGSESSKKWWRKITAPWKP